MSTKETEKLYKALDRVVSFNALSSHNIPILSLNSDDFDTFKKYNTISNGEYRYRGLTLRRK